MASLSGLDTGLRESQPLGTPSPDLNGAFENAAIANRTVARQNNMTPEQATEQMRQLQELTIPPDVMAAQSEAVKTELKRIEDAEFARELRENPALARYAAKMPQMAAIPQQELQEMTGLSKKLEQQSAAWRQATNQTDSAQLWWKEAIDRDISQSDLEHRTNLDSAIQKSGNLAKEGMLDTVLLGPASLLPMTLESLKQGGVGAAVGAGVGATVGGLTGGASGAATGAIRGAKLLGGAGVGRASMQIEGGLAYKEYLGLTDVEGKPIDKEAARTAAIIVGAINGGLEIGFVKLLASTIPDYKKVVAAVGIREAVKQVLLVPTKRAALMEGAKLIGKVWVGETAIEVGQAFVTQTGQEIAMDASGQQFSAETRGYDPGQEGIYPRRWGRELGEEAKQAAASMVLLPVPGAAITVAVDVATAKQAAKAQEQAVKDIADFHSKSSFSKRDPEAVKQYATEVGKETGSQSVYIPVEKFKQFFQDGASEASRRLTGDTKALEEAEMTGTVEIPVGDYLTKLVGTPAHDALTKDIKYAADGLTANEISELIEGVNEQDKAATETVDAVTGDATTEKAASASTEYDDLLDNLTEQLIATGHTPQGAESFATLMASGFESASKATGKTIQQLRDAGFEPVIQRAVSKAMLKRGSAFAQSAYHGSPHRFTAFDLSKIGTGEGAQAYGHGLYFAESKDVAKSYQSALSSDRGFSFKDRTGLTRSEVQDMVNAEVGGKYLDGVTRGSGVADSVMDDIVLGTQRRPGKLPRQYNAGSERAALYERLKSEIHHTDPGALYEVDIPDEAIAKMIDWDKPLSEQPESVRKALGGTFDKDATGEMIYEELSRQHQPDAPVDPPGTPKGWGYVQRGNEGAPAASKWLNERGIPGIKYLDSGSRAAGEGSRNFVLFDDKLVKILGFNQANRGHIQFDDGKAIITLLADADRSTFLHETGHLFLEMLRWAAAQPDATEATKQRMDTLLKWFKVDSADQITDKHHEQFADGFLTYLREGKAPSSRLQEIFNTFAAWLVRLYKNLKINGVVLNDDVRKVMDELVESEQDATQVEREAGHDKIIDALRAVGISDSDLEVLAGEIEQAHQDTVQKLTQQKLKLMEREQQSWWQEQRKAVEDRVRSALWQQPVYRAISVMRTGKLPDGTFPPNARWFKLDKASLEAVYGKKSRTMEALKNAGYYNVSKDNKWINMPQHDAAKVFGMQSGDELVQSILNAPPLEDAVQAETDAEMRRLFPDASFDMTLAADARNSVLAEQAPELLEKVLRVVRKAQNNPLLKSREAAVTEGLRVATKPSLTAKAAKQIAAVVIGGKTPQELHPGKYRVNADKLLRQALTAIRKREWGMAVVALEKSIINRALFTESTKQKQKVGKIVTGWRKQSRRKILDKVGKQAGAGYAEALELVFDAVRIRTVPAERKAQLQSFNQWFEAKRRAGESDPDKYEVPPTTSELLRALTDAPRQWQSLTVDQIKTIDEDVQELRALASAYGKLRMLMKGKEITEVVESAKAQLDASELKPRPVVIEERDSFLAKYIGTHRRFMTSLMLMDGAKDNGFFWNLLGKFYTQSANNQTEWNKNVRDRYLELVKQYGIMEQLDFTTDRVVPGTDISMSRAGRVMVALHAGSELNRKHLLDGGLHVNQPLTEGDLQKIIDTLDEKDIEFIKGVWKINEELFHYVQMNDRRVRGKAPPPKKRQEVVTRFGVLDGGYMPIRENPRHSIPRNATADGIARAMMTGDLSGVMPSDSFTKEAKEGARHSPLSLSIGLIEQHMAEVVHYLSWHEYLVDAYRVLGNRDMANAIRNRLGNEFYTELLTNLKTVAHGDLAQYSTIHRLADATATASSVMMIGFNFVTMLLQPLGLSSSWSRLGGLGEGGKWLAVGATEFFRNPVAAVNAVRAESPFMESRAHIVASEQERVKASLMGQIGKNKAEKAFNLQRQFTTQFAFFGIVKMQTPVDVITWIAAKEKAMADADRGGMAMSEADARLYADEMVASSQGSGRLADLPHMLQERGAFRLASALMTFFAAQTNQYMIRNAALKKVGIKGLPDYMGHILLLMILPGIANSLFQAWRRDDLDDMDEEKAKKLAKGMALEVALQPALGLVGIREGVGAFQGYQWRGTAGTVSILHATNFISQTQDWKLDEGWIRSALMAQSLLTGVGGTQAWRVYQGIEAANDDDPDTNALQIALFGEPQKK
jgi:hypothetical protein